MSTTPKGLDRLEERLGELLSAREGARTDFSEYKDRPVEFMREILDFQPWSKQEEVARSVLDNKRTHVRGFHGAGKDAVLAALLLWGCFARQMLCIVVSATEKQLLGQVWGELSRMWSRAGLGGELYVGELRLGGEKRIRSMTSHATDHLTGHHNYLGTGVLVGISESQSEGVEATAFDASEANSVGSGSRILVVGNPTRPAGRFFEVSRRSTWNAIRMSAFDHPNVATGEIVIPGGPDPTWPDDIRQEFGEDSAFFQARVLAEFPTEGTLDSLLRRDWIEAAHERHQAVRGVERGPPPALALDVARSFDRDESVTAVVQRAAVLELHAWRSRDLVVTSARFLEHAARVRTEYFAVSVGRQLAAPEDRTMTSADELDRWLDLQGAPHLELVVDAPSVGSGVVDEIRRRGRTVREWWGWKQRKAKTTAAERFLNARAEAYWGLRQLLQDGEAAIPPDPLLTEELLSVEWSEDTRGRVQIEGKDSLRKRLRRSPDRMDSVVMGFTATAGVMARAMIFSEAISI